jgi:hypothetical protein
MPCHVVGILAAIAQSAEHGHGKAGVVGSIPTRGSNAPASWRGPFPQVN